MVINLGYGLGSWPELFIESNHKHKPQLNSTRITGNHKSIQTQLSWSQTEVNSTLTQLRFESRFESELSCHSYASKPVKVARQVWNETNTNKLLSCLDDTDWPVLLNSPDADVNVATDTFIDYMNFCIEECIPTVNVTIPANDKTWITPKIKRLIDNRNECFKDQSSDQPRCNGKSDMPRDNMPPLLNNLCNLIAEWHGLI